MSPPSIVIFCQQLFNRFPDPVILADQKKMILYFNSAAQQLFTIIEQPLLPGSPLPFALSDIWSPIPDALFSGNIVLDDTPFDLTIQALDEDSVLFFLRRRETLSLPPQILSALSGQLQDITSPLMYVSQLLSRSLETDHSPKTTEYLSILNQNAYRLTRILRMLSTFEQSLNPTSHLVTAFQQCDIAAVCRRVAMQIRPFMEQFQLHFSLECASGANMVRGSAANLERMLYQLLSNAMKATPAGGSIKLQMKQNDQRVYLTVSDTGNGIPDHVLGTVFHRFGEDTVLTDTTSGLGLGLTFVRHVAKLSNGNVALTSKAGEGTHVTVTLPVVPSSDADIVQSPKVTMKNDLPMVLVELADILPASSFLPIDLE